MTKAEIARMRRLELVELRATLQLLRELFGGCLAPSYSLQVAKPPAGCEVSRAGRR